ncbi:MAG TPA: hypothetical protein PKM65_18695 [Spirochaetota bacterium]|nr:hypothetical protein [Spirochaetota bacterium]HNT13016.1 hypothetical protein [Spirochaetota bacterium]
MAMDVDRARRLFGLDERFGEDELAATYRILAKLNHPDVSARESSDALMASINEAYALLRNVVRERTAAPGAVNDAAPAARAIDPVYEQYKKGFAALKAAFESYFGETEDRRDEANLPLLRERLRAAKRDFSVVITDMPYSAWVDDAIDKVGAINKWLHERDTR